MRSGAARRNHCAVGGRRFVGSRRQFYNSLEAPALVKYPLLALFQEFLRANGAVATLSPASGSTTFAILHSRQAAESLAEKFKARFGRNTWTAGRAV